MLLQLLITELSHSCATLLLGKNMNPNPSSRPGRMREPEGPQQGPPEEGQGGSPLIRSKDRQPECPHMNQKKPTSGAPGIEVEEHECDPNVVTLGSTEKPDAAPCSRAQFRKEGTEQPEGTLCASPSPGAPAAPQLLLCPGAFFRGLLLPSCLQSGAQGEAQRETRY